MEWREIEVNGERTVKLPEKLALAGSEQANQNPIDIKEYTKEAKQKLGGVFKRGDWAWLIDGCHMQIFSLINGQTIVTHEFTESGGFANSYIIYVEELFPSNNAGTGFLAICLRSYFPSHVAGSTCIAVYSVEHCSVLSCMEIRQQIICAHFMGVSGCRRSLLQNFDGCLALGSSEGVVTLVDLNMRHLVEVHERQQPQSLSTGNCAPVPCTIVDYSLSLTEIHRSYRQCQERRLPHFGLRMEVVHKPCAIRSILPIDLILGLAIGLEDGRFVLYDLPELQIIYIGEPQLKQAMSPLVRMDFLEPTDDPRPCLYIWTLHDSAENLTAMMHAIMYEKRLLYDDGMHYFETFQTSALRLQLPLEATQSKAITCQAISTVDAQRAEGDSNCLCALAWYSVLEEKNKLVLFDLNQWYKEEMPYSFNCHKPVNYLAAYKLNGIQCGLDAQINIQTIAHFNSIQRYEEHFYPNSLSFDCALLLANGCRWHNWEGAQNRFLKRLRVSSATIFLEPEVYFEDILRARLIPQFMELNPKSIFTKEEMYYTILSVAVEHNCFNLLRDCAKSWEDGSFLCNHVNSTGLCLSTLTDWLWQRASDIKQRCSELCTGIFEHTGYPLDKRERKELGCLTRQLKLLLDLMDEILVTGGKRNMPEKIFINLQTKQKSLKSAADYHKIVLWLLNIGLLPDGLSASSAASPSQRSHGQDGYNVLYKQLRKMYVNKRSYFAHLSDTCVSKKTGSCRFIYIDTFIEHACKSDVLRECWLEGSDDGLYPPSSIKALLRILLVPDLDFHSKCAILFYFLLDLHMLRPEQCKEDPEVLSKQGIPNFMKFPGVFELPAEVVKTVHAFWNLDHDHFLAAVDEFVSPMNGNAKQPQWLLELLIEALLAQNVPNLALRVLELRPQQISPLLKLKTLLANELIAEAFQFSRSSSQAATGDDSLLELFFSGCLCAGKFGVIRELALNEREGLLVQRLLKRSKTLGAEQLHFVYLLQKSKYIEAVSYMDELSKSKNDSARRLLQSPVERQNAATLDTPNLVLSAFNTTMTPVTQGLTDVYFRIKNKLKKREVDNQSPVPLSCQLIKQDANGLLGGIYHSSALSAHFATYYWSDCLGMDGNSNQKRRLDARQLLSSHNAPFLRKPQSDMFIWDQQQSGVGISYPQQYRPAEKRSLAECDPMNSSADETERQHIANQLNPTKRRRLFGQQELAEIEQIVRQHRKCSASFSTSANTDSNMFDFEMPPKPRVASEVPLAQKSYSQRSKEVRTPGEIHSILKGSTPEPSQRMRARSDMHFDEETRNLRFMLPSGGDMPAKKVNNTIKIYENSEATHNQEKNDITLKVQCEKRKLFARSISSESQESDDNNTKDISEKEENFFSPLSSHNASLVTETECASLSSNMAAAPTICNKLSYLSGPQPRKPLSRLSAEHNDGAPVKPEHGDVESVRPEPTILKVLSTEPKVKQSVEKVLEDMDMETSPQAEVCGTQSRHIINVRDSEDFDSSTWSQQPVAVATASSPHDDTSTNKTMKSVMASATTEVKGFNPTSSSSRVSATQSKFAAKLANCSTVIGGLTYLDSISVNDMEMESTVGGEDDVECKVLAVLDTTLGMSTYDLAVPTKSDDQEVNVVVNANPDPTFTAASSLGESICFQSIGDGVETIFVDSVNSKQAEEKEFFEDETVIVLSSTSTSPELMSSRSTNEVDESYSETKSEYADMDESVEHDEDDHYNDEGGEQEVADEIERQINIIYGDDDVANEPSKESDDGGEDDLRNTSTTDCGFYIDSHEASNENDHVEFITIEKEPDHPAEEVSSSTAARENVTAGEKRNQKEWVATSSIDDVIDVGGNSQLLVGDDVLSGSNAMTGSLEESIPGEEQEMSAINTANIALMEVSGTLPDQLMQDDEPSNKSEMVKQITAAGERVVKSSEATEGAIIVEEIKKSIEEDVQSIENVEDVTNTTTSDEGANFEKGSLDDAPGHEGKREDQQETVPQDHNENNPPDAILKETDTETESGVVDSAKSSQLVKPGPQNDSTSISPPSPVVSILVASNDDSEISELTTATTVALDVINSKGTSKAIEVHTDFELLSTAIKTLPQRRRGTRGVSVPQQTHNVSDVESSTINDSAVDVVTPQRHQRAKSLQPKSQQRQQQAEEYENATMVKITLDRIKDHTPITLDSPSTRTRLKLRLSSMDSELDASIVSGGVHGNESPATLKRERRTSVTSSIAELQPLFTPKRTRRHSIVDDTSGGSGGGTPMVLRSRSALSAQTEDDEDAHSISGRSTPKRGGSALSKFKNIREERTPSVNKTLDVAGGSDNVFSTDSSPKNIHTSASAYSTSTRRLTRTQLAVMEKSAAIAKRMQVSLNAAIADSKVSPPTTVASVPKRRISRSANATPHDSDDTESISSHLSAVSGTAGGVNQTRRITRSSVKDRDEIDDDSVSVSSSLTSSTKASSRTLRSRDQNNTPNKMLAVIPEDEGRTSRNKHSRPKKH